MDNFRHDLVYKNNLSFLMQISKAEILSETAQKEISESGLSGLELELAYKEYCKKKLYMERENSETTLGSLKEEENQVENP